MAESDSYIGVTDQELELATSAKEAFDSRRYENCLSILKKLVELRQEDARVTHNKAVAEYLLSNYTKTDEFRKTLQSVEVQFERDAESNGSSTGPTEKSVLLFNKALIHHRLHQYSQARSILEDLSGVNESLNKQLGIQVCLLLVEVFISTYQLGKASEHIEALERRLFGGPLINGGGRGEKDRDSDSGSGNETEKIKACLFQFRARLNILHKNIKQCKKDVKNLTSITGPTACCQFLKANVEYLRANHRKALKVLSSAPKTPIVTDAGECLGSLMFNNMGCIHYEIGKYQLAAHYFRKAVDENDAALNGYPPLDRATPLSGRPLSVLGVNCRHILLYNLGLQQLYGGKPTAAFDSFLEVVQVYHSNPRLWLRLAEACIASHAQTHRDQVQQMRNKSSTVQVVMGEGIHQKLILAPMQWPSKRSMDSQSHSAAMPAPTLEFGSICLQNALFLLPSSTHHQSRGGDDDWSGEEVKAVPKHVSALPGLPINGDSLRDLQCCILACRAYVTLWLGDPVMSLKSAKQLLDIENLPGGLKYVGYQYAAESLLLLNRYEEALRYLNPEAIDSLEVASPSTYTADSERLEPHPKRPTSSGVPGFPFSVQQAQATTMLNLCSLYCIKKEYEMARKTLQQSVLLYKDDYPPQVVLMSAYIEIMTGNMSQAILVIKKHQPFPRPHAPHKRFIQMDSSAYTMAAGQIGQPTH